MITPKTNDELLEEIERLRFRLDESESVVEAIRKGIVDAVVVNTTPGESVYTLEGADRPYRLLAEQMQQGVAVLNSEGEILYCNPWLANLFNAPVESMIGVSVVGLQADAVHAKWTDLFPIGENASIHREIWLRRHDGSTFPASLALSVLPLQKFCLLLTDLRQQKLHEELIVSKAELLTSETRYRRLFETAKDGVLILDSQSGRITDANPFMSELLGYAREHFLGKELWEIGLFTDKSANEAAVRELKARGYIRYEHLPLETNHHLRVEVEVVANVYDEGHHSVIQCNIRDITERSRLEKQLHEQAVALADLHRRKDEFLAMLGHELRNPLAPITNALQLLKLHQTEDKRQEQARSIIERQVKQLTRLVDDLLEVSRITTGKIHLQQERVSWNGIVENALEATRLLMSQRQHQVAVTLWPQPLWLNADAARLEQVVVNLLNNAAKYTANGGQISLAVQLENEDVVLRVRDTGVGIAADLLPHIFDLFTQAERSLDRSQGGLGIGLCVVQRLVELHGGRVEVSSVLGQGSEFVVRLPLMADGVLPQPSTGDDTSQPTVTGLRVLVVDDNVDAAEMLGLLLTESGHEVRINYDGPTTTQAALDFRPNVVLMDIGLPGLDGFEVAKRMRQLSVLRNVVLVAVTGYGQDTDRQRSKDAGFDHHLVKPIDFKKLQEVLATVSTEADANFDSWAGHTEA